MHYRRLGRSGLKVSEISLGAWVTFGSQVEEDDAVEIIKGAYEQGVNFFDNADMYANGRAEEVMGKAMRDLPREGLVVSSKVFWPTMPGPNGRGLSRKHIFESVHASLKRLGTDYLDLYYCHRYDPDSPIEEVVRAMSDLILQGKVLYWGTSEWDAAQVAQAVGTARQYNLVPPTMEQPQYNLFHRERVENELAPICREYGLGLTTWSPLYFGLLTGKYNDGIPEGSRATLPDMAWVRDRITPERVAKVRLLSTLAEELDLTPAQLSIAWILRRKEVSSVITGATRLEQLDENLGAAEAEDLMTDDVLEQIEEIFGNAPE
ncbi:MAG TPA: aldo/keto reductase [Anaerolineaceae bacterium]|nr:aldo/keto reductase [Anaerolineaceae bacterium]HPN51737.1 aldo/keto reductase [Anaerolineaceae bacterium]